MRPLLRALVRVVMKVLAPFFPPDTDPCFVIGIPLVVLVVGGMVVVHLIERFSLSRRRQRRGKPASAAMKKAEPGPEEQKHAAEGRPEPATHDLETVAGAGGPCVPRPTAGQVVRVQLTDLDTGEEVVSQLQSKLPDLDAVSLDVCLVDSPMGKALIGTQCGETITFTAPAGVRRLRVDRIL